MCCCDYRGWSAIVNAGPTRTVCLLFRAREAESRVRALPHAGQPRVISRMWISRSVLVVLRKKSCVARCPRSNAAWYVVWRAACSVSRVSEFVADEGRRLKLWWDCSAWR